MAQPPAPTCHADLAEQRGLTQAEGGLGAIPSLSCTHTLEDLSFQGPGFPDASDPQGKKISLPPGSQSKLLNQRLGMQGRTQRHNLSNTGAPGTAAVIMATAALEGQRQGKFLLTPQSSKNTKRGARREISRDFTSSMITATEGRT